MPPRSPDRRGTHRLASAPASTIGTVFRAVSRPPLRRPSAERPSHRSGTAHRWALAVPTIVLLTAGAVGITNPAPGGEAAAAAPSATSSQTSAAPHQPVASAVTLQARPAPRAHLRAPSRHAEHRHQRHVALAPSNARQTVRAAQRSGSYSVGQCLQWSRLRAGIPPRYPDAATAWEHATGKRPGDRHPPVGAAVYWTGGGRGDGHVAISVGQGKVRSTDAPSQGQVATVPVRWPERHWGLHYAGWSNSINGYTIRGVATS
jgi:hypothetical protein